MSFYRKPQVGDVYRTVLPVSVTSKVGSFFRIAALEGDDDSPSAQIQESDGTLWWWATFADHLKGGGLKLVAVANPQSLEHLTAERTVLPYKGKTVLDLCLNLLQHRIEQGRKSEALRLVTQMQKMLCDTDSATAYLGLLEAHGHIAKRAE